MQNIKSRKSVSFLFFTVGLCFTLNSCMESRMVAKKLDLPDPDQAPAALFERLQDSSFNCKWLNAKLTISIYENDKVTPVNGTLKIKTDSILWVNITGLGIEMIRACLTKDTLKLINRIDSKYILTDPSYIHEYLQVPLNFEMFQALIFGNFFPYVDEKNLRKVGIEEKNYKLSTLGKRKVMKESDEHPVKMELLMDPNNFRVISMLVDDMKNKKKLETTYADYRYVEDRLFPFKTEMRTIDKKPIRIKLEFTKVSVNKPQTFPFNIPADFQRVK